MKSMYRYALLSVVFLFFVVLGFFFLNPGADSKVTQLSNNSPADAVKNVGSSMALLPELAESMGNQNSEYHISKTDECVFKAHTPSHGTSAVFGSDGVTISQKEVGEIKMSVRGSTEVTPVKTSESKVEYTRGDIVEWYINSPLGIEQGFTLNSRPEKAAGESTVKLRIDLETSEQLQVKQSEDRKSIQFVNSETDSILRYGKLQAFDAKGTELASNMRLTDNGIVLEVNDSGALYPVVIDPIFESQKIVADDAENEDHFGRSVHIDGEYAVVGSPYDNIPKICPTDFNCDDDLDGVSRDQGSAYVFKRMAPSDWQQVAKLIASDGSRDDMFGYDVGISGRLIVVGSPYDNIEGCDLDEFGIQGICEDNVSDHGRDQGSAYVFYREDNGDWTQIYKLLASDGQRYDHFGTSVHIDGDTAVVGSPDANIHQICLVGLEGCNCPDGIDNCEEGINDGNRDQGAAYIYAQLGPAMMLEADDAYISTLFETQKITAEDGQPYDRFGTSVSIFGTIVVVGAPDDNIEIICLDGVICDEGLDGGSKDQGSAYVFDKTELAELEVFIPWVQIQKLIANDGYAYDHFGTSVDIYGTTIVVGSPDDNVHECEDPGDDNVNTGDFVCSTDYDSYNKDQGSAYVFEELLTIAEPPYLPWVQVQKLIANDGHEYDHYGFSVAIYNGQILVGSPYDNVHVCENDPIICIMDFIGNKDQGSAYLYQFVSNWGYEFVDKLLASDGAAYDRFGKDVSLTEGYAISGAPDANLIFVDPEKVRVCDNEVTIEDDVEDNTEVTEENTSEDSENTTLDQCGPKDQGAAYIYESGLIFEGASPGLDNRINLVSGTNATPGGKVAIIYGYIPQDMPFGGNPCHGTVLGINPFKLLGTGYANPDGTYNFPVFVPNLANSLAIYLQAVDLSSCTTSAVFYQIFKNN